MSCAVSILGSGVAGLCVAAELSERGCSVTVVDPYEEPGPHGCSWWAGGMLAPDCESEIAEEAVVRLGRKAAKWWKYMGAAVTHAGSIVLALGRDRQELDRFARRTSNHELLDRDGLAVFEPQLAERFDCGLYMHDEAHLDPRTALLGLQKKLQDAGVRFSTNETAANTIVDCRGLAANDCLPDLRGVKGEMLVLHSTDIELSRPVRLLHPRFPLYIVPRGDGFFMLGATQIESSERHRATARSVVELLNAAYALHPAFAEAEVVEIGVDARPAFPDNLPRIADVHGRLHVNGLFRHGYLLAPALAGMVGDYLLEGKIPEVWHAYSS